LFKREEGIKKQWSEFDQSTLYTCVEISQWHPFIQLINANKKEKAILLLWKITCFKECGEIETVLNWWECKMVWLL
jgi:hypothetical protein